MFGLSLLNLRLSLPNIAVTLKQSNLMCADTIKLMVFGQINSRQVKKQKQENIKLVA